MLRGCLYSASIGSAVAIYAVVTHWCINVSCTCLVFFSIVYASIKRLPLNMYVFMCLKKCVCPSCNVKTLWHVKFWVWTHHWHLQGLYAAVCVCFSVYVYVCVHIPWRAHTWMHTYTLGSISLDGWIAEIVKKNHASCCWAQQVFRNVGSSLITMFFPLFSVFFGSSKLFSKL